MENIEGNVTTIIKFAIMMIAPYFSVAEATQNQIIAIVVAVVGLVLAYLDAKHNNTLFKQDGVDDGGESESC